MTELAALNVKINGDSADLQSDIARAKKQLAAFEAQANKANKGTKKFSGSMGRLGNVSRQTRAAITNTSYQLQDIAVQLSMGTRASTVFAQQLPQLASGFGAIGAVVGVLAGVGIPALAFAFSAMGGETLTLEEKVEKLKDALDAYSEASEKATMTTSELKEKFGEGAAGLKTTYELLQQIADERLKRQLMALPSLWQIFLVWRAVVKDAPPWLIFLMSIFFLLLVRQHARRETGHVN